MKDPEYITAGFYELLSQAKMTAKDYLDAAISDIDSMLGEGYAAKHPELIGAYMHTASFDLGTAVLAQQIRAGLDNLAYETAFAIETRSLTGQE